ncbi:MAG TPA: SRPBCC family protein [Gaiellaceae bacterium]
MAENTNTDQNGTGRAKALLSSLMTKEVAIPAAATAAAALAYGARQAGSEAKEKVEQEAEEVGRHGAEGAKQGLTSGGVGKLASKIVPGAGGGGGGGHKPKKTRRLPIQRWTDVAVPVDKAYEQWTKFEEFPKFMHRVLNVKQEGDKKVSWDEKIWFSKRHWEGEITDKRKNRRVAWKTTSGMSHAGVVTFHSLDDSLTRVMVTMDFVPQGMIEKMASGLRFVKRAVQADLARYKAFVEFKEVDDLEYKARPAEAKEDGDERAKRREERREAASRS